MVQTNVPEGLLEEHQETPSRTTFRRNGAKVPQVSGPFYEFVGGSANLQIMQGFPCMAHGRHTV